MVPYMHMLHGCNEIYFESSFQVQSLKEALKSMVQKVTTLAESQRKFIAAGEDQETRAISVVNAVLRCRICLSIPRGYPAYAHCCEALIGCLTCVEDNESMGNLNCPSCNQATFGRNLHRVAGWTDVLEALAEDDDVPIIAPLI